MNTLLPLPEPRPGNPTPRITVPALDAILGLELPVLQTPSNPDGAGYVKVVDYMGSDQSVIYFARQSHTAGVKKVSDDRTLIRHLTREWHTSTHEAPEITLQFRAPIFVCRHYVRHRTASFAEESARFSELVHGCYIPGLERMRQQGKLNKQGSDAPLSEADANFCQELLTRGILTAQGVYEELLARGLARETARDVVSVATLTTWCYKMDAHNLMKMLRLRSGLSEVTPMHAQEETAAYADVIAAIVQRWLPLTWEAVEDYWINNLSLSAPEWRVLQLHSARISDAFWVDTAAVLSAGEIATFRKKLRLMGLLPLL